MIFWPSLVVASFPKNPLRVFYCFLLREALGPNFSETVFVPGGVRGRRKATTCLSYLQPHTPTPPPLGIPVHSMWAFLPVKKPGRHGTLLGVSGPSVLNGAELGVFQDNCPSCLEEAPRVSCLQMPPAVSFQAKLLMFHVSSSRRYVKPAKLKAKATTT